MNWRKIFIRTEKNFLNKGNELAINKVYGGDTLKIKASHHSKSAKTAVT